MAYQETKPLATDLLYNSQDDIQKNFAALKTLIDVNHGTFGAADEGKHKYVTLPEQGAAPVTAADEMALYTKAVGGVSALFLRNEGAGDEVDITTAVKANPGLTTLPSGIILAWGQGTINAGSSNSAAITFHTAFPTAVLQIQLTPYNQQTGAAQDYVLNAYSIGVASFQVNRNGSFVGTTASFSYLAIGY